MKHLIGFSQNRPLSQSSLSLFIQSPSKWKTKYIDLIDEEARKVYFDKGSATELYLFNKEEYNQKYRLSMGTAPSEDTNMYIFVQELINNYKLYENSIKEGRQIDLQIHYYNIDNENLITSEKGKGIPLININQAFIKAGYSERYGLSRVLKELDKHISYYVECLQDGVFYLSAIDLRDVENLGNKFLEHPFTKSFFEPEEGWEKLINYKVEADINPFRFLTGGEGIIKSLLGFSNENNIPNDLKMIVILDYGLINHTTKKIKLFDIKTTSSPIDYFQLSIKDYKYYLQDIIYPIVVENSKEFAGYTVESFEFLVGSFSQNKVARYAISPQDRYLALSGYKDLYGNRKKGIFTLMEDLNWHIENDKWEYSREIYENNGLFVTNLFGKI
jgi:hypothetical protein